MIKILLLSLIILSQATHAIIPPNKQEWFAPFSDAIGRLSRDERQYPSMSKKTFIENASDIWGSLYRKKSDWTGIVDFWFSADDMLNLPNINPNQIKERQAEAERQDHSSKAKFNKKDYVLKVFPGKIGTLVFILKNHPDIVVKIDNRPADAFSANYRNYSEAFRKTQEVQSELLFDRLYLPLEAEATDFVPYKVIFSEKVPLFSSAEIDNRILLQLLLSKAENIPELHNKLKFMYKQMLHYICRVNFDDINYGNIAFANDGRFASFDTDSQTAKTGVLNFLKLFFGYKLLTLDETMAVVNQSCAANDQAIIQQRITQELYNDHANEDAIFESNQSFADNVYNFILEKKINFQDKFNFATVINSSKEQKYAKIMDKIIQEKLNDTSIHQTDFGRHCTNITEFTYKVASKIHEESSRISLQDAEAMVLDFLNRGIPYRLVYSALTPIDYRVGNSKSLNSFICF